jgi:hypothetical protein
VSECERARREREERQSERERERERGREQGGREGGRERERERETWAGVEESELLIDSFTCTHGSGFRVQGLVLEFSF